MEELKLLLKFLINTNIHQQTEENSSSQSETCTREFNDNLNSKKVKNDPYNTYQSESKVVTIDFESILGSVDNYFAK